MGLMRALFGHETGKMDRGRFSYYLYHPYFRLLVAWVLPALNFLMYGEDPIVHSYLETEMPVAGHSLNLIILRYPPSAFACVMKVLAWLAALMLGFVLGRVVVHHMLLRDGMQLPCLGWKYIDDDDLKPFTCYNPTRPDTPYNEIWWWGDGPSGIPEKYRDEPWHGVFLSGVHYARGRSMLSVATKATELGWDAAENLEFVPSKRDWERADYQQSHETFLEVACPSVFHPRKHYDHSKGSVLVTGATVGIVLTVASMIYNRLIVDSMYKSKEDAEDKIKYTIDAKMGLTEHE
eukprot:Hpha_TRINITY_DN8168_c2_g1::TRINITY_DN8168_c2_g1_i1::g.172139::m.172139